MAEKKKSGSKPYPLSSFLCSPPYFPTMALNSGVSLHIVPGVRSFFDQPIRLKVTGLTAKRTVELRSQLTDDKGITFQASAIYCSDLNGEIDLDKHPSMGGSYSGTQAMGLFTSMRSVVPHHKLFKKDASTPILVYIELIGNGQVLAKQTLERCFMAEGVQKLPLENHDGIVCTLFIPPGKSLDKLINELINQSVNVTKGVLCREFEHILRFSVGYCSENSTECFILAAIQD